MLQKLALVKDQLRVTEVLYGTVIGPLEPLALISAVGGDDPISGTFTVTLSEVWPISFEQLTA